METHENPVIDERITYLRNATKTITKGLSKAEKEFFTIRKTAARYVLKYWDNAVYLKKFLEDEEMKGTIYHVWCVAQSRYDQLVIIEIERRKEFFKDLNDKKPATMSKTPPTAPSSPSVEDSTPNGKRGRKSAHYVGEIHPNGKWVWTEWKPGHFDWKSLRGKHHKNKPSISPDNTQIL